MSKNLKKKQKVIRCHNYTWTCDETKEGRKIDETKGENKLKRWEKNEIKGERVEIKRRS